MSFSGMVTRNGRIAVSLFSPAAGVDESVTDVIVAMAITPILMARVSCSNRFMRPLLECMTPDAKRGIYQTNVSTTPSYHPFGLVDIAGVAPRFAAVRY
jgi:hypothetical protein